MWWLVCCKVLMDCSIFCMVLLKCLVCGVVFVSVMVLVWMLNSKGLSLLCRLWVRLCCLLFCSDIRWCSRLWLFWFRWVRVVVRVFVFLQFCLILGGFLIGIGVVQLLCWMCVSFWLRFCNGCNVELVKRQVMVLVSIISMVIRLVRVRKLIYFLNRLVERFGMIMRLLMCLLLIVMGEVVFMFGMVRRLMNQWGINLRLCVLFCGEGEGFF